MRRISYWFAAIALLSSSSCKKFLETTPTDFLTPAAYYSTPEQLQIALNGVYDQLGTNEFYASAWSNELNWSTDEGCDKNTFPSIRTYNYGAAEATVFGLWRSLYTGINRANNLLANIDKSSGDQQQKDLIKGQALFLRGYFYFILASNWGDVPLILSPTSEINEETSTSVARSPLKDVYAQVLSDMTTAEALLQTQTAKSLGYGGKVSVTAVQGLLARVCLFMAGEPLKDTSKYADALMWAKKVVNSGEHALNPDYKQIFINYASDKYDVKESIWEIEFLRTSAAGPEGGRIGNNAGVLSNDLNIGVCYSLCNASGKLYKLYNTDPLSVVTPFKNSPDLRRDWNCANYTWGTGAVGVYTPVTDPYAMSMGKFRREYEVVLPKNKNSTPINFPVLRYSDVLLMLAEAENAVNGPTSVAYDAINQVRRRGYGILEGNLIKSVVVTNGGSGYVATNPPTVVFSGGGGSGAAATPIISGGKITGVNITSRGTVAKGSYYTSAPTISFVGGAGTGALATATITQATDADLMPGLSKEDFLLAIQEERSRELCFEALRRSDLIRWGIFIPTMKALITDIAASATTSSLKSSLPTAARNLDTRHLLFPIPLREITLNKALTQNPGW